MPRTYSLPVFNLTCNVWKSELPSAIGSWSLFRPTRSADLTPACQLYLATRGGASESRVSIAPTSTFFGFTGPPIELRMPAGTQVTHPQGIISGATFDLVEVPAGGGVFYVVYLALDQHKGFPNEYRLALLAPAFRDGSAEDSNRWDQARGVSSAKGTA